MNKKTYKNITKKDKSQYKPTIVRYTTLLKKEYNCEYIKLNMKNKCGEDFILFLNYLKPLLNEFEKTANDCLKYRDTNINAYMNKFKISEINSSLLTEGIKSSRRLVKLLTQDAKKDSQNKKINDEELKNLIINMNTAIDFIWRVKNITKNTINALYKILIDGIDLEDPLEPGALYRHDVVEISDGINVFDTGIDHEKIDDAMDDLINFINEDRLNKYPIVKALSVHYVFAHIHPYFDFNGRMARLLHLWVLKNINIKSFEKNLYLSEAIYQNRLSYDKYFDMMRQSPRHNINITLWVEEMIKMFICHNYVYIKMKKLSEISKVSLNDHGRLFLMDIIIKNKTHQDKWFKRRDFNKYYPDYAKTTGDRVIRAFRDSKLFEIRKTHSLEFRLKRKYRNNF